MVFQQYLCYFVAVSFIDGGNWSTRRKPPTRCTSLTNFINIIISSTPRLMEVRTRKVSGDRH
jgi:hypothetical protein